MGTKVDDKQSIPEIMVDHRTGVQYRKGRFFGKGGFAKCYEITDMKTGSVYAGKIVSKKLMVKHNQKEKMTQEIAIHKELQHKHIVGFHGFFEDSQNVYIILELCRKRSMMELHKRRKALTEPEVRYYIRQILLGVLYLHQHKIIHRDLKLGNLFLNDEMEVKIGDFGLAARIEYDGERKKTLCGTPNYIAPEILNKRGHSFEVDVWSIGCILYTLLVGKPPFETNSLKETYSRIKRCEYYVPTNTKISPAALKLIRDMLQQDPKARPKVEDLLTNDFFLSGFLPNELPQSCLTMAPHFNALERNSSRRPLHEVNAIGDNMNVCAVRVFSPKKMNGPGDPAPTGDGVITDCRLYLMKLRDQLKTVLKATANKPNRPFGPLGVESTDPAAQPVVWVSKWVDYSDKYGFGYQLCDESVGVVFNDSTKLVMLCNKKNVHYIRRDGTEDYHLMDNYPVDLDKKMKLLSYFRRYMNQHLVKAGGQVEVREGDSLSRLPHLYRWFRAATAVVMCLTNGTVQVNFTDHTKIILCPLMAAVTYIDHEKNFLTFRFTTIETLGCSKDLRVNLEYAFDKIGVMLESC